MKDLDLNQELLFDMTSLGKAVIVRSSHGQIKDLLASHERTRRPVSEETLRTAFMCVRSFDDDANWEQQETSCSVRRSAARKAWTNFCNDCLIVQTLRFHLYNKPLVVTSMDHTNMAAPPGTCLPTIKIRGRLKSTLQREVKKNKAAAAAAALVDKI